MYKSTLIKKIAFSFITLIGLNMFTSCDSCSRDKDGASPNTVETDNTIEGDTVSNDHTGTTTTGYNTPQSSNRGTGNGRTTTSSGQVNKSGTSTNSSLEAGSGGNSTGYGDSNSPIVNSSTPAVRNGKPIESSGASGTGMGTGTGSTGNNSKVTRPEDQRN